MDDPVEIDVEVLRSTEKALKVTDGDTEEWIPKSQIYSDDELVNDGHSKNITLPFWLAEDKGFA